MPRASSEGSTNDVLGDTDFWSRPQGGRHVECRGKKAQRAAIFQEELCMAILKSIRDQLHFDRRFRTGELSVVVAEGVMTDGNEEVEDFYAEMVAQSASAVFSKRPTGGASASHPSLKNFQEPESDTFALRLGIQNDRFVNANTGLPLDEGLGRAARETDIGYFESKGVWELRIIDEARMRMGRSPISVRWVEVNKGDDHNPNIRSRLVAGEIRTAGQDAIVAPTPSSH